jgi:hypothetical protein
MARGGARPNSGPKPIAEQICRIADIHRCLDVVMEFVNSDAPLKERAEMAKYLAAKSVPQNVNLGGQPGNPIEQKAILTWMK